MKEHLTAEEAEIARRVDEVLDHQTVRSIREAVGDPHSDGISARFALAKVVAEAGLSEHLKEISDRVFLTHNPDVGSEEL